MSDNTTTVTNAEVGNFTYVGVQFIQVPFEVNRKGLKTITLDLEDYEMAETGTKEKTDPKTGRKYPCAYIKFRVLK